MSRPSGIRLAAETRHQGALIARDPGPMIGYAVMGLLLITVTRPLYAALGRQIPGSASAGIDQAAAGMAVMFSLFALKVGAAHLLNERTWRTWDRLLASPAGFAEILAGKALPLFTVIAAQQALLFGFAAAARSIPVSADPNPQLAQRRVEGPGGGDQEQPHHGVADQRAGVAGDQHALVPDFGREAHSGWPAHALTRWR